MHGAAAAALPRRVLIEISLCLSAVPGVARAATGNGYGEGAGLEMDGMPPGLNPDATSGMLVLRIGVTKRPSPGVIDERREA